MNLTPLIVSFGSADPRLHDTVWATKIVSLARTARVALMLLGDGSATEFDPITIATSLVPIAGRLAFVPTVDANLGNLTSVGRSILNLSRDALGNIGWQPSSLVQPHTAQGLTESLHFVDVTRRLWTDRERPLLVQSDADPLWSRTAPDILVIDRDSPLPAPGPKVLLRIFTAMAGLDEIEKLYNGGIIDGIHLAAPDIEEGLQALTYTMLPAMVARGLVMTEEADGPLRTRLGIE